MAKRLCLPKSYRDKIVKALKTRDVSLDRMYQMSSSERNAILKSYVGKDFANIVNAKFEQSMLSRQRSSLKKWIESVTTKKDPIRRDMLKKVDKVKKFLTPDEQKGFLKDLAEDKLGVSVSEKEAGTILKLKENIDNLKPKVEGKSIDDLPLRSPERLEYGYAVRNFKKYVGDLKLQAEKLATKDRLKLINQGKNLEDLGGFSKSMLATMDNSFIGRQGIKTLYTNPTLWAKTAVTSVTDFAKTLGKKVSDDAVIDAIYADIFSRPNAVSGNYTAAKNGYGLGVLVEEAFPTTAPERLPVFGRVFKASENAFQGSALRMRADLADLYIKKAEQRGLDVADPEIASGLGSLVGSMTGRGELDTFASSGKFLNNIFFSPKFVKATFNTLTGHLFDKSVKGEVRKIAATNTIKVLSGMATVMTTAKLLDPENHSLDPRSTLFGTVKIPGTNRRVDVTGGMRGMAILAARIFPTLEDDKWGWWRQNKAGQWTFTESGQFGAMTGLDMVESFFEGKTAPFASAFRDIIRGQNFAGERPTLWNTTTGLITPISGQMLIEEVKEGKDDILIGMLLEGFGFNQSSGDVGGYGSKWTKLREKYGDKEYGKAIKEVTTQYNAQADRLQNTNRFKRLNDVEKSKELKELQSNITSKILQRFRL